MVLGFNLPDWKTSLNEAFQNYVKTPLERSTANLTKLAESKANELNSKIEQKSVEFKTSNKAFQNAIITILFASFCVGVIVITFKNDHD